MAGGASDVALDVEAVCTRSVTRTLDMFLSNYGSRPERPHAATMLKHAAKVQAEYASAKEPAQPAAARNGADAQGTLPPMLKGPTGEGAGGGAGATAAAGAGGQLVARPAPAGDGASGSGGGGAPAGSGAAQPGRNLLVGKRQARELPQPEWHAPWKLMRVISGHLGWVRCIAVDTTNEWFATGSADRTIKIWDLASGTLKLTLTGHISAIRALCISDRHPYIFSAGEDKMVKCWDLETNRQVRAYHGHLSGVYCASLHPTIDVLCTGGRDSVVRVWDVRTRAPVFVLSGHKNTVVSLETQAAEPQVISGSMDSTVRLYDLKAGKTRATLTNHKKSVRALALHPSEYSFATGSADNIKKWRCPDGEFMHNLSGHNTILNALAVNQDGVLVSGGNDGTMHFWDWKTGHCFQQQMTIAQPGSLESEHGIFATTFDRSGARLLTGEADKTIKVWKEDAHATPQSHPVNFTPVKEPKRF